MKQADANFGVPVGAQASKPTRRSYAPEFKRAVVAQCRQPGASVSGIALSHGINANVNVIRKWLPLHGGPASSAVARMLPVIIKGATRLATPKPARMHAVLSATRLPIEISLGAATVRLLRRLRSGGVA